MAYINSSSHISRFENRLNGSKNIILRLSELYFIDMDGVEAIDEIIEICKKSNREIYIVGVNSFIVEMLRNSDDYRRLEAEGKVFERSADALKFLGLEIKVGKSR
jgi:MFS superfamily sulfate permease-like transporter